jgi:hypothetical protein
MSKDHWGERPRVRIRQTSFQESVMKAKVDTAALGWESERSNPLTVSWIVETLHDTLAEAERGNLLPNEALERVAAISGYELGTNVVAEPDE